MSDPRFEPALGSALVDFAGQPTILVAVDFDGTLAPLVDDPMDARALPGSEELLGGLARLPRTVVAVVSGRALADLLELTRLDEAVLLIGSHGLERSSDHRALGRDTSEEARFAALDAALAALLDDHPGARVERKPHSLVLHTRGMSRQAARDALRAAEDLVSRHEGVVVTPGKDVLELATRHVGKGVALRELAAAHAVDSVLFIGDDVTDERAFVHMSPQDVSVKVGAGSTAAAHRVADEAAVLQLLHLLTSLRSARVEA